MFDMEPANLVNSSCIGSERVAVMEEGREKKMRDSNNGEENCSHVGFAFMRAFRGCRQ